VYILILINFATMASQSFQIPEEQFNCGLTPLIHGDKFYRTKLTPQNACTRDVALRFIIDVITNQSIASTYTSRIPHRITVPF
jgi:hypothetical protein